MIHYEEMLKRFPSLALPREAILKAPAAIETTASFMDVFEQQYLRWQENIAYVDRTVFAGRGISGFDRGPLTSYIAMLHWYFFLLTRYIRAREHAYRVLPNLALQWLESELPRVQGKDFYLPAPCFYVEFPDGLLKLPQFKAPHKEMDLIGCYVIDMRPATSSIRIDLVRADQTDFTGHLGFMISAELDTPIDRSIFFNDERDLLYARTARREGGETDSVYSTITLRHKIFSMVAQTVVAANRGGVAMSAPQLPWQQLEVQLSRGSAVDALIVREELSRVAQTHLIVLGEE